MSQLNVIETVITQNQSITVLIPSLFLKVGLYLEHEVFSHGQLYVGCSRVGTQDGLKIFAPQKKTRNVVYPEALQEFMSEYTASESDQV